MSDITSESVSEAERWHKQYAEIAELAGALAHEIRNPLSTISMNLKLVAEDLPDDESANSRRLHTKLDTIQTECNHLENILEAYLQFVRVGEIELEPTDLNEVVKQFLDFFKPQAESVKVEISFHPAADLPEIPIDSVLMKQVLQNLARNSLDAMPEGGVIELQTSLKNEAVVLEVIDNGQGMPKEACAKIFRAFYSRKANGSGLGLSTVRKIVEAHRGQISCESEPDRGTRMTLTFPVPKP
ncbi:MAG: ATP-binding protein [Planctomycetaceae bacterium]|jgi:two-component system, NtrC family, sensor histidine kinase HydH|nr:ATP-binding protein [bacterium]MDC0307752.1 ATP-binding protein [Planctomycetaceae bacterium]MDG2388053.1 ATP-binding protein [Planctomycetaceae bacterium]